MNSLKNPQIIMHLEDTLNYTPFSTLWVPNSAKLVVLGENPRRTGTIAIYNMDIKNNKLELIKKSEQEFGQKCGSFDVSTSYNKRLLTVGDFKGNLKIFDIENLNKPVYNVKAHNNAINSIDICGNGISNGYGSNEIVTGSKDGSVKIFDPRVNDSVFELKSNNIKNSRDCWCVCFGNNYTNKSDKILCAGYDNGDIKMVNLKTQQLIWNKNMSNGITDINFDRKNTKMNKLYVSTLESKFNVFNLECQNKNKQYSYLSQKMTNNSTIWKIKPLPQNRDIWCTCNGDGSVNIWKYTYPMENTFVDKKGNKKGVMGDIDMIAESKIATQPIVNWDWNPHKTGLACMISLDQSVKVAVVTKLDKI